MGWKLHCEEACIRCDEFEIGEIDCQVHRILQRHHNFEWETPSPSLVDLGHYFCNLFQVFVYAPKEIENFSELLNFEREVLS